MTIFRNGMFRPPGKTQGGAPSCPWMESATRARLARATHRASSNRWLVT